MDGNLKPYSESSIQSAYEKACEVRDLAVDGEHDFTELASKYSDDSEITYSFGKEKRRALMRKRLSIWQQTR